MHRDGREPCQDGPRARSQLPKELPAERDQGLGAWIHERTDRPLEPSVGVSDGSRVGWTSGIPRDPLLTGRVNDSAKRLSRRLRQALGGSEGLSFMR